jgi:hypothetical protein
MYTFNFTERELNEEIESRIQTTTLQQRKIADLEFQLSSRGTQPDAEPGRTQKKMGPEKRPKTKSPTRALIDQKGVPVPKRTSPEHHITVRFSLLLCDLDCTHVELLEMHKSSNFQTLY